MRKCLPVLFLTLCAGTSIASAGQSAVELAYQDARPILKALDEILPQALRGKSAESQAALWPGWLTGVNSEVRARLQRGDEDTLVNYLFFGTSFTSEPRLAAADFKPAADPSKMDRSSPLSLFEPRTQKILQTRMTDLSRALADPKNNDRLLFFCSLVAQKGLKPGEAAAAGRLQEYLLSNLIRVLKEAASFAAMLEAAKKQGDASAEFAERSTLFRDRGLSVDTSLRPNFALEESLRAMRDQKLISSNSILRVAIIGPGLDFTDKDAGYDYYAPQTIQPFALMDTLIRLGLARAGDLEVTTLDVSSRVNDHLIRARQQALKGVSYAVQLPRDARVPWKAEYLRYWERFGDQLGRAAQAAPLPAGLTDTVARSVLIRPEVVGRIHPVDLNIVTQHLVLAAPQQFDLIIATNVFVYYNVFQQSLALANVECMLKPGGFLLSNNALLELPIVKIHSVGYLSTAYSDRASDGDNIVWYQRF